jgi:hypothetical protein
LGGTLSYNGATCAILMTDISSSTCRAGYFTSAPSRLGGKNVGYKHYLGCARQRQ